MASASLRERLADCSEPLVAGWCTMGSTLAAEVVARSGVDVVCIDLEHGLTEWDGALASILVLSAAGLPVLVRVGSQSPPAIARVLDAGCDGVIVPHVETAADAAAAVEACWYPPQGRRSWGPTRAALLHGAHPAAANSKVVCIPMLESATAVGNAAAIAATPGVAAVLVGSNDLCMSLSTHERSAAAIRAGAEFRSLLADVAGACHAAGVPAGAPAASDAEARLLDELGYGVVVLQSDVALLQGAVIEAVGRTRGHPVAEAVAPEPHRY